MMSNKKSYLLRFVLLVSDFTILNISFYISYLLFITPADNSVTHINTIILFIFNALWMVLAIIARLYSYKTLLSSKKIYRSTGYTFAAHMITFSIIYYFSHLEGFNNRFILSCYTVLFSFIFFNRLLLDYTTEFIFKNIVVRRKVIIVGYNDVGKRLVTYFNTNKNFYHLEGIFDNIATSGGTTLFKGKLEECIEFAAFHKVTDIYSTILPEEDKQIEVLHGIAENQGKRVLFVAANSKLTSQTVTYHRVNYIDEMPVLGLRTEPLQLQGNIILKRTFDIIFSSLIIVLLLSWLTPVLAILIKLNSKGPVFFAQQRSGKDNLPFWCYKFRSMRVNENADELQATKNDNRITSVGAFLRKTSLDELPQFFNVFIGDMSITGPRPHMLKHTEEYSAIIDKYLVRHFLKPGITGWAQVNGCRGETTDVSLMEKRVAYDIEYMESWSPMLDIKIIFMTIINIFKGEKTAY